MPQKMNKKDYQEKYTYYNDEFEILQKQEDELDREQNKVENTLMKMQNRSYVWIFISLVPTMGLFWYSWIRLEASLQRAWLTNPNYLFMWLTIAGLWIVTLRIVHGRKKQERLGEAYWAKGDLFKKPTLAQQLQEMEEKRRSLRGKMDITRYHRDLYKMYVDDMDEKRWYLYDETLNSELSDEEKNEIMNALEGNNDFLLLRQTESKLFETRSQIRFLDAKRKGIEDRTSRIKLLMRVEVLAIFIVVLLAIFGAPIATYYLGNESLSQVANTAITLVPRIPYFIMLVVLLLLYIATFIKYIAHGKGFVSGYFRHCFGIPSIADILRELKEEEQQLLEEEKKLCHIMAMLETT